jgi:hypothetical protein
VLRSKAVRSYLLGSLSILIGLGLALILALIVDWSQATEEFWYLLVAFAISIPVNKILNAVVNRLIGPPIV